MFTIKRKVILASASPRRKELLKRFLTDFSVEAADIDETIPDGAAPEEAALGLARKKALKAAISADGNSLIIAADTIVAANGKIYGKPILKEIAAEYLRELRGKAHKVVTGVCCIDKKNGMQTDFHVSTIVTFTNYSDSLISWYIETGEPLDRAGSYAIQGTGCILVEKIDGDYDNVVGLPVGELMRRLEKAGIAKAI